jgi:predicted nucleotidyltransferase
MAGSRTKKTSPELPGVAAGAVRAFLHQSAELDTWTASDVQKALSVDASTAKGVLAAMQMVGYIESVKGGKYRNTSEGNAVAQVSNARPIKRETAQKSLDDMLQRVKQVNLEREYLYSVEKVVLFGPYLEGAAKIKDVDVAVELSPKERNAEKLAAASKKQAEEAEATGKRFKSFADRRAWSRNRVIAFLKGKSRALSIYELNADVLARPHEIVFTRHG